MSRRIPTRPAASPRRRALLLAILPAVLATAFPAAALATAPGAPILESTDPASPGTSLTPRVIGKPWQSVIIFAWRPARLAVPRPAAGGGQAEISIYTDPACAGAPVATGSGMELETTGIAVTVAAESTTDFYATQTEAGEASPCSDGVEYQQVASLPDPPEESPGGAGGADGGGSASAPVGTSRPAGSSGASGSPPSPPAPPALRTVPGGLANDVAPLLVAFAPGAERVDVFRGAGCRGSRAASGSPAQLAAGIAVPVAPNATTTFSAAALGAGGNSHCSPPVAYTEDSLAPRTRITMGPGIKTRRRHAVFRFADVSEDPPGTTFRCRVNRRKWRPCASPLRLKRLRARRYVLRIRATDQAGNVEHRAVKRRFTVIGHRAAPRAHAHRRHARRR